MRLRFLRALALLLCAFFALAACESSEERAERHFETGLELLAEGDVPRALVEFRNVLKLDPRHKDARMTFARVLLERGDYGKAYANFLRVVELYPDEIEARIELAELAISSSEWDEAKRHVEAAYEQAPDKPRIKVANDVEDMGGEGAAQHHRGYAQEQHQRKHKQRGRAPRRPAGPPRYRQMQRVQGHRKNQRPGHDRQEGCEYGLAGNHRHHNEAKANEKIEQIP